MKILGKKSKMESLRIKGFILLRLLLSENLICMLLCLYFISEVNNKVLYLYINHRAALIYSIRLEIL